MGSLLRVMSQRFSYMQLVLVTASRFREAYLFMVLCGASSPHSTILLTPVNESHSLFFRAAHDGYIVLIATLTPLKYDACACCYKRNVSVLKNKNNDEGINLY